MEQAIVTVSSKRQITLPADEVHGDKIILSPKITSYTELLAGSLKDVYGRTAEEVDAYVGKERETWDKVPMHPSSLQLK